MSAKKTSKAVSAKSPKKTITRTSKKTAVKKQPVKKTVVAKKAAVAKKTTVAKAKLAAPKKDLTKKIVKTAHSTPHPTPHKPAHPHVSPRPHAPAAEAKPAAAEPKKARFNQTDLTQFKVELLAMRDRITGQSGSMRNAALQRTDEVNPEEDGTDAFMRLQTLEQVSSQHQILANINEALRAIEKGTYGVCDMCGELINKHRLSVLPFAKNCIQCQSEMERSRRPGGRR